MSKPTYASLIEKIRQLEEELTLVRRQERGQAIQELKWQWQTTMDAVGVSICVLDDQWHIMQCNQATLDMIDKPADEIIGRKCFELIHDTSQAPEDCPVRQLVTTKKRETSVLRYKDRWIEVAADPILDETGELKGIVHTINDITAHKTAEEAIKKGESTLRSIFEAAPTGIGMVVDRIIVQANNKLCDMTGYSQAELIGQSARLLYPSDADYEYVGREKYAQIAKGGTGTVETRWHHKDGRILDILLSSTALYKADLSAGVTFTALDITQRKHAEFELTLFHTAVEASSDAIGMSTPEGRHWYQNKSFDDLFGDVGDDPPASLYVDQGLGRDIFRPLMAGGAWSGEVEMFNKESKKVHILLRAYAVKDETGQVISLVGVHTDITERKRFEGELRRSEQRFRAISEMLPQTVFEMDHSGRLTFVNNNALEVFGYTREDLKQGINVLGMIASDDRQKAKARIEVVLRGTAGSGGRRYSAVRKDGSIFPVLIYSAKSVDEHGAPGIRGIIIDISEQEKLARERDQFEEQYIQAQKMEAVGRLAGGVAHDLNNMLSPILGYGELLLSAMQDDAPNRQAIEQMFQAGMRAKDLVHQLLAFSRKQALNIQSVNLVQVLEGFKGFLDRILREDIQLEIKFPKGIPDILADAGQIEQVVMNLAVNSQDAMPDGGKISIEVGTVDANDQDPHMAGAAEEGPFVLLTVSDTGHGMDAQTQDRIFDPFFTTKGQGKGTGLGLATVYGIVKQHNGSIRVSSESGTGTQFRMVFPAALSGAEKGVPDAPKIDDMSGTEKILIVEDNEGVRALAETILSRNGYQTIALSSGRECLALLSQNPPLDLLLSDVILEDTNGKELFNKVQERYPDIKVLYMSGYTDDVIVHHGVLEEGISFIQKPFSVLGLLKKVREVLDGV